MTDILIIYAHPNKEGHCGCYLQLISNFLNKTDSTYEVLDLYDSGFDPILKNEEHYTSGRRNIHQDINVIQQKIKQSRYLIFIYPTWWQNMPSILKGFIDRVFTPNFAYSFKGKIPKGLLKDKRALIFTSTGSSRLITKAMSADRCVKVLRKDLLNFCGIKSKAFITDKALKITETQKGRIENKVQRGMKYLGF